MPRAATFLGHEPGAPTRQPVGLETALADAQARRERLAAQVGPLLEGGRAVTLEVGCGHGHFLSAYAGAHPERLCLGVDLVTWRIARSNRKRDRLGQDNLHFFKADAFEFLGALPEGVRLATVFFLFPDPWPKRKHHRRRLVRREMLDLLAERTAPGALLCVRSDHAEFFAAARGAVLAHPAWVLDGGQAWPFEQETYFSQLGPRYESLVAVRR